MASLAGQQFEKYDVLEEVGHGGMAVVYRARDRDLDREVAIKVLHAHLADREESRQRLRREAVTVAKLRHENIVEIYDYSGVDGEESYIVTEFIHGLTLRKWLDGNWHARPALAALVIHRLCLALIPAHEIGIVHRDIKPENVMVRDDGTLKLMDFGIAQILDHQKLTMTGQLLGSPAYMAPELISGKPIDSRTDLFAVGIMLYQLATGQLPFQGRNPHEVLNRIADCEYAKASSLNPIVDEELEAIIAKALSREPDARHASARAFANDLEDYLAGMGVDPDGGLLERYFADPDKVVDELDEVVIAHLLERADAASAAGNAPRALKLLGRVLEYEPENRKAQALLDAARLRGQRMRQLLMGIAGVAVIGMVTAAALLMRNPGGAEQALLQLDADDAGLASDEREDPSKNPRPANESARPDGPSLAGDGVDAAASGDGDGDGDGDEEGEAVPSDDDAGDDAATGEAKRPTPEPRPSGATKTRPPSKTVVCNIRVDGTPMAQLAYHDLVEVAGAKKYPHRGGGNYQVTILPTSTVTVRLEGKRYEGNARLDRATCEQGVVAMRARPKRISLDLEAGPYPAKEVLVVCMDDSENKCSRAMASKWRADVKAGEDKGRFKLRFSSIDGTKQAIRELDLHPGKNPLTVNLVDVKR